MTSQADEAFVAFVTGAKRDLLKVAWLLTGDGHRSEELVQDALARTYGAWRRVQHNNPHAYARRVLVNAKTDTWRRRRREQLVDDIGEAMDTASRGSTPDIADAVAHRGEIVAALQVLNQRERLVVVLRYYADLSEAATAVELGVAVGTVKSPPRGPSPSCAPPQPTTQASCPATPTTTPQRHPRRSPRTGRSADARDHRDRAELGTALRPDRGPRCRCA